MDSGTSWKREMKSDERTQGLPGHEASPAEDA